ncbi:MAG: hypothetical protein PF904_13460 [Kiritimatiellae bacterium]|nr:hypothetical protein [Kiritimatiellia bacterium]
MKRSTAFKATLYAALVNIASETAAVLGKQDDAVLYKKRTQEIAAALFAERFNAEKSIYGDGSQTTAILPLAFDLVPQSHRQLVFDQLVTTIHDKNKGHIDTGIFGTRYLLDVLCDFGQADLGINMLKQPGYPGFVYQIEKGATTLWEQWSFKGGMNSHNHAMFAGVSSSFYTRLAGISAGAPGFKEIKIKPCFPASLNFAEAEVNTPYGKVFSRWQREGAHFTLMLSVPVNTTALLTLPCTPAALFENEKLAASSNGVRFVGNTQKKSHYRLVSGKYRFDFTL